MRKKHYLTWQAGSNAKQYLLGNGLDVEDLDLLVGASGGPKWLVLHGLDKALFPWLQTRKKPLPIIGSSIGSWRFACLAQQDPLTAQSRFLNAYLDQSYAEDVTAADVSQVLDGVLRELLGEQGVEEILRHPVFRTHIVCVRSKHILRLEQRFLQGLGLLLCALANLVNRSALNGFFSRVIFNDPRCVPTLQAHDALSTEYAPLTRRNLELALRASGSVPLVLEGVEDIPDVQPGVYRDGGVTDYHFDQGVISDFKLVLYPHFYPRLIPGWFDKSLRYRHLSCEQLDNVLLVSPTQEFVAKLPYGKIPDRKDFFRMDDSQRVRYWKTVVTESERLGDEFNEMIERNRVADVLEL